MCLCVRVCRREEGLVRRCELGGTADRGCVEAGRSGSLVVGEKTAGVWRLRKRVQSVWSRE